MGTLDGKVAIVTGASRGIGAEIARRFGKEGAAVAVAARTTDPGASPLPGTIGETVEQIRAAGGTAVAIRADLSKPEDRERLVRQATSQLGAPDILVSNAAVTYFTPVEDFTARPTPGTVFHHLTTPGDPRAEPPSVMAEAALLLCSGDPRVLTGRIAYSQQLIAELGGTIPARG
jgi:NAD(P)-dependent dehydrogenase (short-subunit alcohol dehydrogenase family)